MAALIDCMELGNQQRVELDENGITWLVQDVEPGVRPAHKMRLDPAAATRLFDFLLIYQDELCRWRDGMTL